MGEQINKILPFTLIFVLLNCSTADHRKEEKDAKPQDHRILLKDLGEINISPGRSVLLKELETEALKDVDMLFKIANSFYDSGNFSEAGKLYSDILAINPHYKNAAACHFNLGLIALKKNDWKESVFRFRKATPMFIRTEDVRDSWFLLMESLKNKGEWEKVINESDAFLRSPRLSGKLEKEHEIEAGLRKAEAFVMSDVEKEGVDLANYFIYMIRKGKSRRDLLYDNNYAYANFILGLAESRKFKETRLKETEESLLEKCKIILSAQSHYLKAIQTGVIYWTNASAFEISKLYTSLYQEMTSMPVPETLNEEEAEVYKCELWKKISGLLSRPRRYLKKSIDAAVKINESNQYTEKSFKLLQSIEEVYSKRESECRDY